MSLSEKKAKRERALYKLGNQISVLKRTATSKQLKAVKEIEKLYATL